MSGIRRGTLNHAGIFLVLLTHSTSQHAQLLQDASSSQLNALTLSSVIAARNLSTEAQLQRLATQLMQQAVSPAATVTSDRYLPPKGLTDSSGINRHPMAQSHGFFYLPAGLEARLDISHQAIAYCPFNFRGLADVGRHAGAITQAGTPDDAATAFAILTPGNNGRFEHTCSDLARSPMSDIRNPSRRSPGQSDDDIIVMVNNRALRFESVHSMQSGPSVQSIEDLRRLTTPSPTLGTGGLTNGQIRLVRDHNQLFISQIRDASGTPTIDWKPVTPAYAISPQQLTASATEIRHQAQVSLMSGSMAIGYRGWASTVVEDGQGSSDLKSALTLGSQRIEEDGISLSGANRMAAGISFLNTAGTPRIFAGLVQESATGPQSHFVIRHQNNRGLISDSLRISGDGRLWLGQVAASRNPLAESVRTDITGTIAWITENADYIGLSNSVTASEATKRWAGIRVTNDGNLEFATLQSNGTSTVISSDNIYLNTSGNIGVGIATSAEPLYKLDVAGDGRFSGQVITSPANGIPSVRLLTTTNLPAQLRFRDISGTERSALWSATSAAGIYQIALSMPNTPSGLVILRNASPQAIVDADSNLVTGLRAGLASSRLIRSLEVFGKTLVMSGLSIEGQLTIQGNLTSSIPLDGTSATFNSALTASNGLIVGNSNLASPTFSATAGLVMESGSLQAEGGFSSTGAAFGNTITFQNGLIANAPVNVSSSLVVGLTTAQATLDARQGMTTSGDSTFSSDVTVKDNMRIRGDLILSRRITGLGDITLNFYGYTNAENTRSVPLGSATQPRGQNAIRISLQEANPWVGLINQSVSSSSDVHFSGASIGSDGVAVQGNIGSASSPVYLKGTLDGTADLARALVRDVALTIDSSTTPVYFELNTPGDSVIRLNLSSTRYVNNSLDSPTFNQSGIADARSGSVNIQFFSPNLTIHCKRYKPADATGDDNRVCSYRNFDFQNIPFYLQANRKLFLANTYELNVGFTPGTINTQNKPYNVTIQSQSGGADSTAIAAPKLRITGDFMTSTEITLSSNSTLTLSNSLPTFAAEMNQNLNPGSDVTFGNVTVTGGAVRFEMGLNANSISASDSAKAGELNFKNASDATAVLLQGSDPVNQSRPYARFGAQNAQQNAEFITVSHDQAGVSTIAANRFAGIAARASTFNGTIAFAFQTGTSPFSFDVARGTGLTADRYTVTATLRERSLNGSLFGRIPASRIRDGAISTVKIRDRNIEGSHLSDAILNSPSLVSNGAIQGTHIALAAIGNDHIETEAIESRHITNGQITSNHILDGTITLAKLSDTLQMRFGGISDIRLKGNLLGISPDALVDRLRRIRSFSFQMSDEPIGRRQIGVLAQEIQPLFPELVSMTGEGPHTGFLAVDYSALGAIAAAGIGEVFRRFERLGLSTPTSDTLMLRHRHMKLNRLFAEELQPDELRTGQLVADKMKAKTLTISEIKTDEGKSRHLRVDTAFSGKAEGTADSAGLIVLNATDDGHYLVQASASDGSYVSANMFVAGGIITLLPVDSNALSLQISGCSVMVMGSGQWIRATWLKTA